MSGDLSAFQDLMAALGTRRPGQSAAEDERVVLAALAKHARELAERQRVHHGPAGPGGGCSLGVCCGDELADLIDPEVER